MRRTLWWTNGLAMPLIAAAAIVQPIRINSAPCDAAECDPHGYVAIFTTVPAVGVALLALVALLVLSSGYRAGFGIALAAAAACGGLLVLTGPELSAQLRWCIVGLSMVVAALA
ncbi:MAG TPA: hypothetical protein VG497_16965, partial [Kribbella sp.]|nr:hypothetical protein [Kribbella sp.]